MGLIFGEYGAAVLLPLLKVIIAVALACIVHAIIVYASAVKVFANMSLINFFKGIASAAVVAGIDRILDMFRTTEQ